MQTNKKLTSLALIAGMAISMPIYANQGHGQGNGPGYDSNNTQGPIEQAQQLNSCILEPDANSELTLLQQEQLQFMREEEKLARDVYVYLNNMWNHNVFANIAKAEQTHMDSVNTFLEAYNISDPALVEDGQFTNQDLQSLYDTLIAKGSLSLIDALMAGALIEEVDIKDLLSTIEQIDEPAILQMYTNLLYGSYSHLRAFVSQLSSLGVSYTAQTLTQAQVDEILSGTNAGMQMNSAKAMDTSGSSSTSDSCFINMMSKNSQSVSNNSVFNGDDNIQLSSTIRVNSQNFGKNARLVAVAGYTSNLGETTTFMRYNDSWKTWDGNIHSLTFAQQVNLANEQTLQIFDGKLAKQSGQYVVSVGYVLDDGSIVYNVEPMRFTLK